MNDRVGRASLSFIVLILKGTVSQTDRMRIEPCIRKDSGMYPNVRGVGERWRRTVAKTLLHSLL